MAAIVASAPLALLFDSLLASSWTWLALSIATIATLVRALSRIPIFRQRPQALLPPSPSIFSAETEQISSFIADLSRPLQKSLKNRTRCKSAPTLKTLVQQGHDGLGELGFRSWLQNSESTQQCLRKVASTSIICNQQLLLCGRTDSSSDDALKERSFDCRLGVRSRLGMIVNTHDRRSRTSTQGLEGKGADIHHLQVHGALPACKSPQESTVNAPLSPSDVPPCFETQFGWHQLIEAKLGVQWQVKTRALFHEHSSHNGDVVKLWSSNEKNLFEALNVKATSIGALDVDIAGGFAGIAQTNGDISYWDITNEACLGRVSSTDNSTISALCWREESRCVIAGSGDVFKLWDVRSPNLIPIFKQSANVEHYRSFQCEGNVLCIHQGNGNHQFCDLRKVQVGCLSNARSAPPLWAPSWIEAERSFALWEKLSCADEESWNEPILNNIDSPQPQKSSNSFTLRCVTLVRSLSSSGCAGVP